MEELKSVEEYCLVCNEKEDPGVCSQVDLCFGTYLIEISKRKSCTALSKLFYLTHNLVQEIEQSFICLSCIQRLAEIETMYTELEFLNARIIQFRHIIQEQLTIAEHDGEVVKDQQQGHETTIKMDTKKEIENSKSTNRNSTHSQSITQETRRKISHIIRVHDRVKAKVKSQNVDIILSKENLQESMAYIPVPEPNVDVESKIDDKISSAQQNAPNILDQQDQEKENSLKYHGPEIALLISKNIKLNLTTECLNKLQLQPSITLEHIRTPTNTVDQKFKLDSLYVQNFIKRDRNRLKGISNRRQGVKVLSNSQQDRRIRFGEIIKNVRNKIKFDGSTTGLSKYFTNQNISRSQNNQNKSEKSAPVPVDNRNIEKSVQDLAKNFARKKRKRPRCYEERNPKKCSKCSKTFVDRKSYATHYHKYHNQKQDNKICEV